MIRTSKRVSLVCSQVVFTMRRKLSQQRKRERKIRKTQLPRRPLSQTLTFLTLKPSSTFRSEKRARMVIRKEE
jgi:hypothetical protein